MVPCAEDLGIAFAVHPDDPPRDILGLPRIVSNEDDIAWVLDAHDSIANGLTLCSGSLGANPVNDVPAIAARFAEKIHFAHLRNVRKFPDGSFEEAAHLEGDTDMANSSAPCSTKRTGADRPAVQMPRSPSARTTDMPCSTMQAARPIPATR